MQVCSSVERRAGRQAGSQWCKSSKCRDGSDQYLEDLSRGLLSSESICVHSPLDQPSAGQDGQTMRDLSSSATVVITNVA
jgi:hypothetical protein